MAEQLREPMLVNTGDTSSPVPISQAILDGYAPGNELYTYTEYPKITLEELSELRGSNFPKIFYTVSKKLLGDAIPDEVLRATAEEAYSPDNFDLDDDDGNLRFRTLPSGIHIVGLSDGPTASFKDMAMQPFARWMSHLQKQKNIPLTILLSTSGDTGPAALSAFGGLENTEIIAMLPRAGVSPFQRAQMTELGEQDKVHVLEVDGDFSYANDLQMQADRDFDLGAVNSVNIARIIAQTAYHVASYLKAVELDDKTIGDPVDVSVPSGNFGNCLSAIIARKMGLPLRNIIVATNENDTLDRLFKYGIFRLSEFKHTNSSAQDVRMPSNVWRYFAMLYGNDPEKIARIYKNLTEVGSVAITPLGVVDPSVRQGVLSTSVSSLDRSRVIKKVHDDTNRRVILDPHTANGVAAIERLAAHEHGVPMITMETAQPFKFDDTIREILGTVAVRPERFIDLEKKQAGKTLPQIGSQHDLTTYLLKNTKARSKQ